MKKPATKPVKPKLRPGVAMLNEAARTIEERGKVYGDVRPNLERAAVLWTGVLRRYVTGEQVALCMIALKMARLAETPDHADSITDIAGYAAVYKELVG